MFNKHFLLEIIRSCQTNYLLVVLLNFLYLVPIDIHYLLLKLSYHRWRIFKVFSLNFQFFIFLEKSSNFDLKVMKIVVLIIKSISIFLLFVILDSNDHFILFVLFEFLVLKIYSSNHYNLLHKPQVHLDTLVLFTQIIAVVQSLFCFLLLFLFQFIYIAEFLLNNH